MSETRSSGQVAAPGGTGRRGSGYLWARVVDFFNWLHHSSDTTARRFRFAMLIFDIATLVFFIVTTFDIGVERRIIHTIALVICAIILVDWLGRYIASGSIARFLSSPTNWVDPIIVATVVIELFVDQLVFLRLLRALGISRAFVVLRDLRAESEFVRRNQDLIQSGVNMAVFLLVFTSLVYLSQANRPDTDINNFLDALYFSVTTLTTTGFGDITLKGDIGKVLAIAMMILGISLFLRLLQTIFRPRRVLASCPDCGLRRHEADASHCKHCGHVINIPNDGEP